MELLLWSGNEDKTPIVQCGIHRCIVRILVDIGRIDVRGRRIRRRDCFMNGVRGIIPLCSGEITWINWELREAWHPLREVV